MKHLGLVLFFLVTNFACPALAQTNYSKTIDLPPLRISFADLQTILDKSASLMKVANGSIPLSREKIMLRKGGLRVEISGHRLDQDQAKIPEILDSLQYSALTPDVAPVSYIFIDFGDYRRTLSVEGESPDQVDAVFSVIRDELSNSFVSTHGSNSEKYAVLINYLPYHGIDWFILGVVVDRTQIFSNTHFARGYAYRGAECPSH